MRFPSRERQNKWITDYVLPIFELDLPKLMRNYRMNRVLPFTDERMQQIRKDVLAEISARADAGEGRSSDFDYTHQKGYDTIRTFIRYQTGSSNMAPLEIVTEKPTYPLSKEGIETLLASMRQRLDSVPHSKIFSQNYSIDNAYQAPSQKEA